MKPGLIMHYKSNSPAPRFTLLILLLIYFLVTSCENLKNDHQYVGTWQFEEKISTGDLVFNTTRTLKLTKNTYEETYLIQRENSGSASAIIGTSGDLFLAHSNMTFDLKELGTCLVDASGLCTGSVQWYGQGNQYWTDNIPYFRLKVVGEFQADEATLLLTRDLNNDGDIEDTGEDVVFDRI